MRNTTASCAQQEQAPNSLTSITLPSQRRQPRACNPSPDYAYGAPSRETHEIHAQTRTLFNSACRPGSIPSLGCLCYRQSTLNQAGRTTLMCHVEPKYAELHEEICRHNRRSTSAISLLICARSPERSIPILRSSAAAFLSCFSRSWQCTFQQGRGGSGGYRKDGSVARKP